MNRPYAEMEAEKHWSWAGLPVFDLDTSRVVPLRRSRSQIWLTPIGPGPPVNNPWNAT
jgi:hypothetical protein